MKRSSALSWIVTVLVLGGLTTYLALSEPPSMRKPGLTELPASVKVSGSRELFIEPGSSVEAQLVTSLVRRDRATAPLVQTTGAIVATLPQESQERGGLDAPHPRVSPPTPNGGSPTPKSRSRARRSIARKSSMRRRLARRSASSTERASSSRSDRTHHGSSHTRKRVSCRQS